VVDAVDYNQFLFLQCFFFCAVISWLRPAFSSLEGLNHTLERFCSFSGKRFSLPQSIVVLLIKLSVSLLVL
jgi:hypothetical protein